MRVPAILCLPALLSALSPCLAFGQELPPPPMMPESPPGVPAPPPIPAPRGPIVELRSDDIAATLYQFAGQEKQWFTSRRGGYQYYRYYDNWKRICRTPCGVEFDPSGYFQIQGLNMRSSDTFVLPQSSVVSLTVSAGHTGPRVGGILLTSFGGVTAALGIIFTPTAFANNNLVAGTRAPSPSFLGAGLTLLGLGSVMLAGGIAALVLSRTTVRTHEGYHLAEKSRPVRLALRLDGLHF